MFGYYKSSKNYLDSAYHPVETAMTNHDDLVHLLVHLGASVNTLPKNVAQNYTSQYKISLKDWIENEIYMFDTRIKGSVPVMKAPAASITIPPECSGWQKFYKEYQESLKKPIDEEERRQVLQKSNEKEERERLERLEKLEDAKAYFVEVNQLIESHGATTLKKKTTTDETPKVPVLAEPPKVEPISYMFLSTGYATSGNVPQHLSSSYDQLYEACYVGDNEKIQSLCLPAEGAQPGSILLNISVKMIDSTNYNSHCKRLPEAS